MKSEGISRADDDERHHQVGRRCSGNPANDDAESQRWNECGDPGDLDEKGCPGRTVCK
ncbi:hypothetical protein D3C73_1433540 [compost metagenome]